MPRQHSSIFGGEDVGKPEAEIGREFRVRRFFGFAFLGAVDNRGGFVYDCVALVLGESHFDSGWWGG